MLDWIRSSWTEWRHRHAKAKTNLPNEVKSSYKIEANENTKCERTFNLKEEFEVKATNSPVES